MVAPIRTMTDSDGDKDASVVPAEAFLSLVSAVGAVPTATLADLGDFVALFHTNLISAKTLGDLSIAEKRVMIADKPIAARMQAIGARVSIKRTMTPAKYHAKVP